MALTNEDFTGLWQDIINSETFPEKTPLLAHYTSIPILESILRTDELWFSNPLCMNDIEEVRFGMVEGQRIFRESDSLEAAINDNAKYSEIIKEFNQFFDIFANEHAADVYALCLSEHDPENEDGTLSMWRGYGGSGSGAAIVFDSKKIPYREGEAAIIISNVNYASKEDRLNWLSGKVDELSRILAGKVLEKEDMRMAADAIFQRFKIFSLFTKHHGFEEEREWRIVYQRERDSENKYEAMLHYGIGERGVEPKLKLNLLQVEGREGKGLPLGEIVHSIILGPTIVSPLTMRAILRMLDLTGKGELKDRVIQSSIPYRKH